MLGGRVLKDILIFERQMRNYSAYFNAEELFTWFSNYCIYIFMGSSFLAGKNNCRFWI